MRLQCFAQMKKQGESNIFHKNLYGFYPSAGCKSVLTGKNLTGMTLILTPENVKMRGGLQYAAGGQNV